jgi:hypothetical protein
LLKSFIKYKKDTSKEVPLCKFKFVIEQLRSRRFYLEELYKCLRP